MSGNVAYITGENKVVPVQIESIIGEHFVIKGATYKLSLNGVEVLTG